ncbi:PP2C family protein-serine/threonine phosphatase [Cellulomonas sp. 179-A 4D5 NHS]|uniref:PP2C family protein-serine/threonine phosphatase n=1 Tax=Cellulomonas sp. 179-A 4D5 NHS TaxID=3142378 RepID=UPI0039A3E129
MPDTWLARATGETPTGVLARSFDWASTSLGPPRTWPRALRAAVKICFSTEFPLFIGWGPDLVMIYNEAYSRMLGTQKHPGAMGSPMAEVWADVWDDIGPLAESVVRTGEPVYFDEIRLLMERSGFLEETAFTFSYSALRDDDDEIAGMLDIAVETTEKVVASRRFETLGALSTSLHRVKLDIELTAKVAADVLRGSPDVTRAEVHLCTPDGLVPLLSTHSLADGSSAAAGGVPPEVLRRVCDSRVPERFGETLVEPVSTVLGDAPTGVVALTGNPLRPDDEAQQLFLHLVAASLGNALAAALAHQKQVDDLQTVSSALQAAMLPADPGSPGWHTRYRSADDRLAVGGDWYDVVPLGDRRFGLVVGDCVGHGLGAAAVMGQLRSAARALLLQDLAPAAILDGLDRFAATLPGAECASVVCAVVDEETRTVTYSKAGHPPPLLLSGSGSRWLDDATGTLLGLAARPRPEATTTFERGETLVLYTDGLVERRGEGLGDGLERLARTAVATLAQRPVHQLGDLLIGTLLEEGARDDVALVVYEAR